MNGSKTPDQLSYSMRFRSQRHVIHMKLKKNLLPEHFPVPTNNDQGAMQEDYPFVPQDCYYYSYLEGVPGSAATLDTCSGGLCGMLQVDDFTYEIKPLESSSKFEHVVAQLVSEEEEKCDFQEDEATSQTVQELPLFVVEKKSHCAHGFKRPDCAERGTGGSVDRGPPPDRIEGFPAPKMFAIK
ncbi:disintegrin and metalloproteinase domain-containing protein 20-like [Octodon degus]|uniref:Disintegrin and metalloproteinase domain-containing protein 20-like n=1 Tax=Octodon degus TaxID=10160 RepID=A0A6P6DAY9_OCTDE|nr:disintegrin and metalloproteinase domain-containing protein 20-like [Octodon degus]